MLRICLVFAVFATTASGQCESGWSSFGQSCYRLLTPAQSYDFHRSSCENLGGRLVSIVSAGENNFVNQLQQAECRSGQCETFIGLRRNSAGQFESWLDGKPFTGSFYANWNAGEPNNVGGGEACAEIIQSIGKWNDISCTSNRLAMCEKPQPSRCGTGRTLFGDCCYRLLDAFKTFDTHQSDCQNSGGNLVSIRSAAGNNFVQQLQQTGCSGSSCTAYIGLRRDSAGSFTFWLDGSPFGGSLYSNWNTDEPNNVEGSEGCAEIIQDIGKWNDISCSSLRIAVCETCETPSTVSASTPTTTTTTPTTTTASTTTTAPTTTTEPTTTPTTTEATTTPGAASGCESGWSPFGLSCYRVSTELFSFGNHLSKCHSLGGWMVAITSAAENDFVHALQRAGCRSGECHAYMGLVKSSGSFQSWLDGTSFGGSDYANWDEREPNNRGGNEACAVISYENGKWNDVVCNLLRVAVCEKPLPADWCATGWKPFGQCCYNVNAAPLPFDEHRTECHNRGGELVSINSHAENKFVQQLQQEGCSGPLCNAYIGLRRNSAGQFASWLDGTPFGGISYFNWYPISEPNNDGDNDGCAEMIYGDGRWNDIQCNHDRAAVCQICQPPTTASTPTTPTTTESATPTTATTTTEAATTPSPNEASIKPSTAVETSTPSTAEPTTTPTTTQATITSSITDATITSITTGGTIAPITGEATTTPGATEPSIAPTTTEATTRPTTTESEATAAATASTAESLPTTLRPSKCVRAMRGVCQGIDLLDQDACKKACQDAGILMGVCVVITAPQLIDLGVHVCICLG